MCRVASSWQALLLLLLMLLRLLLVHDVRSLPLLLHQTLLLLTRLLEGHVLTVHPSGVVQKSCSVCRQQLWADNEQYDRVDWVQRQRLCSGERHA